jgi:hypothetical protein
MSYAKPWLIPVEEIRNYFGEKIALVFKYSSYYTLSLLLISIVSIPTYVISLIYDQEDKPYQGVFIAFALLVVIWSSCMTGIWE